ncbi:MAG TPA: GNAT family N-acetyltransferase [Actinomycetes bacterium]|nr:GNAT family N-acetyltransferase [Actinomycetes bacterium]
MTTTTDVPQRRVLAGGDLAAVCELLTLCDTAVIGRTDFTEDEIAADLRSTTLESYGWYAGELLVGYGWVERVDTSAKVELDAYVRPGHDPALGLDILDFLERRGLALVAEAGHAEVVFDIGLYRQDEQSQSWLRSRGFETPTSFVRMRIDLDGPVATPTVPGLVLRRADTAEADLRTAHRISEDAFGEHYNHVQVSHESWRRRLTEQGEDFAEVWLAELDGEPVGVLVGTRQFVEDENAGYVRTLGTMPGARGRGVGKALLRGYFDVAQRAGRAAVLLHVDVGNVTGALRLYESVGMRPVLTIDAWTKRSPVHAD